MDDAGRESDEADEADGIDRADEVDEIVEAWHAERPDLDVEPLQVLSRLARLADVLDERRANAFVEHGLQAHEFDVLSVLRRNGEPFELTAGELAARTHVTSGTMTSRLDRLSGRGFLTRRPDPADGRIVRARLTADGRRHVDDAFAALLSSERELLSVLGRADQAALADSLRALLRAITL